MKIRLRILWLQFMQHFCKSNPIHPISVHIEYEYKPCQFLFAEVKKNRKWWNQKRFINKPFPIEMKERNDMYILDLGDIGNPGYLEILIQTNGHVLSTIYTWIKDNNVIRFHIKNDKIPVNPSECT